MNTAIVIGATGLVGRSLIRQLLEDPDYSRVITLVRRAAAEHHEKLVEHIVDFDHPESFAELVNGHVLFSTMGTTRGQAGSLEAQRKVDYTYQLEVAELAARKGVKAYGLVSSAGSNPNSVFPYMKMKGELERDVQRLGFASLQILRPGPLAGEREKKRVGEEVARTVMGALSAVGLFRSMRPITGDEVARAMRRAATMAGTRTHEPDELFRLAQ